MNYRFKNLIDQTMFLGDATTPQCASASLQLFWLSCACLRMVEKFSNEYKSLFVGFGITLAQHFKVFLSLWLNLDNVTAHKLRMYCYSLRRGKEE